MLTDLFQAPATLQRLRASLAGPYLDTFTTESLQRGYTRWTLRGYVRGAVHLGYWLRDHELALADLEVSVLTRFAAHFSGCRCFRRNQGRYGDALAGAQLFLSHLQRLGVVASTPEVSAPALLPQVQAFEAWLVRHRGVRESTRLVYRPLLGLVLQELGTDPTRYTATALAEVVIRLRPSRGPVGIKLFVTVLRMYLRYLASVSAVQAEMHRAVPGVAHWRLASTPRYLEPEAVAKLLAACAGQTPQALRDRAIVLLLVRLGLRAGEVAALRGDQVDWAQGTLRVVGKGRREALLPLPQDVGEALLAYLNHGRPACDDPRLFLRVHAPVRPFATACAISEVVNSALERAGIAVSAGRGAHLLRHTAATAMLRAGGTLDTIRSVLRHRSPETTAHYAKVDTAMLAVVVQPWPEGAPC
jgi:integrase/recombinase XerD